MVCGKCGSEIKIAATFCPTCGTRLERENKVIVKGDYILTADGKELLHYKGTEKMLLIPPEIRKLGEYAFSGNSNIQEVIFEKSAPIISIGEGCFFNCKNLKEVELPDNIGKIERYAFLNCLELSELGTKGQPTDLGANIFDGTKLLYERVWKAFEQGRDIITIDKYDHWLIGFMQKYSQNIDININSVNTIATGAFSYCRNVNKIIFNKQSIPAKNFKDDPDFSR